MVHPARTPQLISGPRPTPEDSALELNSLYLPRSTKLITLRGGYYLETQGLKLRDLISDPQVYSANCSPRGLPALIRDSPTGGPVRPAQKWAYREETSEASKRHSGQRA